MFSVFGTLLSFLLVISICQGEASTCRTSCSADSACWRTALAYRSSQLVEQLFSFSSLAVRLRTVQEDHSDQVRSHREETCSTTFLFRWATASNSSRTFLRRTWSKNRRREISTSIFSMKRPRYSSNRSADGFLVSSSIEFSSVSKFNDGTGGNDRRISFVGLFELELCDGSTQLDRSARHRRSFSRLDGTQFRSSIVSNISWSWIFVGKLFASSKRISNPFLIELLFACRFSLSDVPVVFLRVFVDRRCSNASRCLRREMQVSEEKTERTDRWSFRFAFRRECTAVDGSVDCWTKTTDGFAYGLAAAMADYCQSILKLRQESNASVREESSSILFTSSSSVERLVRDQPTDSRWTNSIVRVGRRCASVDQRRYHEYRWDFVEPGKSRRNVFRRRWEQEEHWFF